MKKPESLFQTEKTVARATETADRMESGEGISGKWQERKTETQVG